MSATPSRRALLAGACAVVVLPGVTAAATAAPGPDAALIALCADYIANRDAFNSGAEPEGGGPLEAAFMRTFEAISEAEPQTMAGALAKARVAKVEDDKEWAMDLVWDLLRLHGGAAA